MDKKDLRKHEFIGLEVEIVEAKNQSLKEIKGKIIDETKNTFTIKNHSVKKVLKNQITLLIKMKNQTHTIDGSTLLQRPEDRLKK